MSAKMTQRRRQLDSKRSSSINNEQTNGNSNVLAAAAAARRRNQHRHYPTTTRSRFDYLFKNLMKKKFPITIPSYLITILIGLVVSFSLYKIFLTVIDYRNQYEYTNVPLKLPRLVNVNDTSPELSPERFWGTYRSNLYFGLKHRSARSLSGGLMWFDYSKLQQSNDRFLRHWCDQNDHLKYGWTYHDGETFGIEQIYDENLHLNIQWLKQITGNHGGDWTTRINVTPQSLNRTIPISLFFYFHHDLPWIDEISSISNQSPDAIIIRGQTNELESFTIKIQLNTRSSHVILRTLTDVFQLDKIQENILTKLTPNSREQPYFLLGDQPLKDFEHNTFFIQLTLTQPIANEVFSFDIIYQSDSSNDEREQDLTGYYFNDEITRLQKQYDERFENIFQLKTKQNMDVKKIQFARSTLSNLIGGISYFTGKSLVAKPKQKIPDEYWTTSLYTAVPSRSFFPRGFLWDEGFHNLLIARWNKNITIDILSHWLDMLNDNGWIPRELILGNEARARVPSEFIVQYTNNANPPTFFLTIDYLLKTTQNNNLFNLTFIQRLEKWYQWYNRTQSGPLPLSYRWRGRNASSIYELNPKTLTSGLDDYPRASHPTDSERHLDLRCWMTLASSVIGKLYAIRTNEQTNNYLNYAQLLFNNEELDQLHWSEQYGMYADYGYHTEHVQLQRVPMGKPTPQQPQQPTHMIRQVTKQADLNLKYVKHFGYVSLFPLMTRILNPQSPKLEKIFNDLQNPSLLWTPYGLRSLAQSSSLYGVRNTEHDPPYWRGAIWINMNYMVLSALQHYAKISGPYSDKARQIYGQLRTNLLTNMYRIYEKTGYVWEQYDDKTGNGQGSHPFTGWSSLIVLIMSELYDE
jgi:mannosyl-oligosaccharide glucosidase